MNQFYRMSKVAGGGLSYLTGFLFLLCGACNAQEFKKVEHSEPVYAELKKNAETVATIRADFTETRYAAYLKDAQKSSGYFVYQKKDKMRWEQQKPSSYIILINGNTLRVNDGGKEKNVKSAGGMTGMIREMLLMIVSGDFQANRGFEKELFQNSSGYLIVLTPLEKKLKQRYDKLELQFAKNTRVLRQLTFFEKGGDKQVMTFFNEKIDSEVSPALFSQF